LAGKFSITGPSGFRVSVVKAGIKSSGNPDLGLIVADVPCCCAATFTKNKIVSPTVVISREHVQKGKIRAVFVNAGNANACTGKRGERDVLTICRQVAKRLAIHPEEVLVCSTGIIGVFLPMDKVCDGIDRAIGSLSRTAKAGTNLTRAIMTTDTKPKQATREIKLGGKIVKIAGIAKGSGMIAPNMATMLAFITTDAAISKKLLSRALGEITEQTFNKVSVDSHSSTNDSAIVLASGLAGNRVISSLSSPDYKVFLRELGSVCDDLARQMAADGEGATCAVTVKVLGGKSVKEARVAVRAIVDSPLVRTAFNGGDPNWGRIVSAVGYSGAEFDVEKLSCRIAGVFVFRNGKPCRFDGKSLSRKMKTKQWEVEVDLGIGKYQDFCYSCDFSCEYVHINADYHT
jgi:glutamate N-acetyltransferase/amino-acid N-acetyltransferase